jgi:diguanylate cyclase (GGDEF)-like protein
MALFLLLLQGLVLFGALLGAFSARRIFGLAPLFLVLGLAEGLKYSVAIRINVDVAILGGVNLGSAVYFTASLAIILVVYLREGVAAVRPMAWSLVFLSFVAAALTLLFFESAMQVESNAVTRTAFRHSMLALAVGSALLFVDIIALLMIFNKLRSRRINLGFALVFTMLLVVSFDTLAYDAIVRFTDLNGWAVLSGIASKSAFVALYAAMTLLYLRLFERNSRFDFEKQDKSIDLFSLLTYQDQVNRLEQQLNEDALTGAFNRRFLDSWLPEQLALNKRRALSTTLLMLDMDHFKSVNDQYGHLVGDVALKHAVSRARSQLRRGDTLCRYGGEEFAIVLSSSNWTEALHVAERIRSEIAQSPLFLQDSGLPLALSVSIGVAMSPDDGDSALSLIRAADKRLYQAKRGGRNRVEGAQVVLAEAV